MSEQLYVTPPSRLYLSHFFWEEDKITVGSVVSQREEQPFKQDFGSGSGFKDLRCDDKEEGDFPYWEGLSVGVDPVKCHPAQGPSENI